MVNYKIGIEINQTEYDKNAEAIVMNNETFNKFKNENELHMFYTPARTFVLYQGIRIYLDKKH